MARRVAVLAGGCFWGMEELFRNHKGVVDTQVGYTGGKSNNPTYETVKTGATGHAEALEITYNDAQISYADLLMFFFQIHDPTTPNQQGNDHGSQYRSAIFYVDDEQKEIAQRIIKRLEESKKWPAKIITELLPLKKFTLAEDFHQDYLQRHPHGYSCHYVRPDWKL